MTYSEIIKEISKNTGISPDIIDKIYKSFWLYIRNSIQELPLKENITETEFLKLRPNFNIPSLGKLCCTYSRYLGVRNRFNYIKNIREKNEKTD